jgi:hypothetical protein
MSRRSPRSPAIARADPSDALFRKISQVRRLMGLPKLRPDPTAAALALKYAETGVEPPPPSTPKYTVISYVTFRERYSGAPVEALLDAWLWDPSKRPVLLAPGNIGAAQIAGPWVTVWIGYALV